MPPIPATVVSWPPAARLASAMFAPTSIPISPALRRRPLPVTDPPASNATVPPSIRALPTNAMSPVCEAREIGPSEVIVNADPAAPYVSVSRVVIATLAPAMLPRPVKLIGAALPCPIRTAPVAAIAPRQMSPCRHGAVSWPLSLSCATPAAGGLNTSAVKLVPRNIAPRPSIAPPESVIAPPVPSIVVPLPISRLGTLPPGNLACVLTPPALSRMKPGMELLELVAPPVVLVSVAPAPIRTSSPALSDKISAVRMVVPAITSMLVPAEPSRLPLRSNRPLPSASPRIKLPLPNTRPSPKLITPLSASSVPPEALRIVTSFCAVMVKLGAL